MSLSKSIKAEHIPTKVVIRKMKTTTLIVAFASGLAIVDTTGMLVDPPPRPITDDFRSKLPPTIRGLPEMIFKDCLMIMLAKSMEKTLQKSLMIFPARVQVFPVYRAAQHVFNLDDQPSSPLMSKMVPLMLVVN